MNTRQQVTQLNLQEMIKEINTFLSQLNIRSVHNSDILEHTLLKLAGVRNHGRCHFSYHNEKSIRFTINDLAPTDALQFTQFFNKESAGAVKITYSYHQEEQEKTKWEYNEETGVYFTRIPPVEFKVDAQAFSQFILPLFKTALLQAQTREAKWLKAYQGPELCKAEKERVTSAKASILFSSKTERQDPDSEDEKRLIFPAARSLSNS